MKLRKGYLPVLLALFGLMAGCTTTLYVPTRRTPVSARVYSAPVETPLVLTGAAAGVVVATKRAYIIEDNPNSITRKVEK